MSNLSNTPLRQVTTVRELLNNDMARGQLQSVAAKHMNPERMLRLMANAIRTTPKLATCEPMSLLGSLMTCASLGLEPNTIMGHAYLIPFANRKKKITEVQLIIGYKGLIDLARRSGNIVSITANVHYDDDEKWEYEEGTEARLLHRPGDQEGKPLHAYAIAKFKDGGHAYVVIPWSKILKTRDQSQGWISAKKYGGTAKSPWATHVDEMAKKTAIRALSKYLPLSTEFRDAYELDGSQSDYSAFALDPTAGLQPADTGDVIDADVQPEKPAPKPKPKPKPAKIEKKEEPEDDSSLVAIAESIEAEDFKSLLETLNTELMGCIDNGCVEAVVELYQGEIERMKGTEFHARANEMIDARREYLAS